MTELLFPITIFVLAILVGFEVISKVPATLHTPLMSGANSIHGIVLVGGMLIAADATEIVGYTLGLVGLCSGLVQAVLVRRLMPRLGERRMILAGLTLCIVGYVFFGFAPIAWLFVLGIPFLCMGGLAGPPAQALMTHQVDAHEQGRLQGALTSLASLAGIFGPALFANLFALFISDHAPLPLPGVAFVLAAVLLAVAAVVAWRVTAKMPVHGLTAAVSAVGATPPDPTVIAHIEP